MKILTITLMTLLGISLMACTDKEQAVETPVRPVKYTTVELTGNANYRTFSGTTVSKKTINLSFRQPGKITRLDMKIGQKVVEGQLLAQLDNTQSRLAFEQGQAQMNAAESNLNTSKLTLDRTKKLYKKGSASLSDLEQAKNGYKTAEKAFEAAEKGVAMLREQLTYGKIYAPTDGTISSLISEVDENVGAGQPVAVLNSNGPMEINLGVPEAIINKVEKGMTVEVVISALDNKVMKGKVVEVATANGRMSATYPVVVDLINPDAAVKSGMAAEVAMSFKEKGLDATIPMVPATAVGEDSDGQFVFLIEQQNDRYRVIKQPVTIGKLFTNGFEILSGLSEGQYVATAGLQTLLHHQEVKLKN